MLDLPPTRIAAEEARRKAPNAKFVLILWEAPLGRPRFFDKRNHEMFDAVMTYDPGLVDDKRYFRFYLPLGLPVRQVADPPFEQRRPLVMVNSNRFAGIWAQRQSGLAGLPFFGSALSGWKISPKAFLFQNSGQLYTRRRQIARLADQMFPGILDTYGAGWQGESMSWMHRLVPNRKYACGKGPFIGQKFDLIPGYRFVLAFENMMGNRGYVSEKIFDAFQGGSVPLYLGDEQINSVVAPDAFVDCRQFKSNRQILEFVRDCGKDQWQKLVTAGKKYLASSQAANFGTPHFVDSVMKLICRVAGEKAEGT
jgi:hypothetical protein